MLALHGVLIDLHCLGLGDVTGKQSADCPSLCMDGQHDFGGQLTIQVKNTSSTSTTKSIGV